MSSRDRSCRQPTSRRATLWFIFILGLNTLPHACAHLDRVRQRSTRGGLRGNEYFAANGPELALALASPAVTVVWITSPLIDIANADWNAHNEPVLLTRDVVVRGDPQLTDWPIIRINYVKHKVRLDHGVTLAFRDVVLDRARSDNPTRVPGIDRLAPTLPGNASQLMLGPGLATMQACFPPYLQKANVNASRRPEAYPGQQLTNLDVAQVGCIDSPSAAPARRCWPSRTEHLDMVFAGADPDVSGAPVPTNVFVLLRNMTSVCEAILDEECMAARSPIGCLMITISLAVKRDMDELAAAEGQGATTNGSRSGGRASTIGTGSLVGAVVGSVAGAFALTALVVLWWPPSARRRKLQRAAREAAGGATDDSNPDAEMPPLKTVQEPTADNGPSNEPCWTSAGFTELVDVCECDEPQVSTNEDAPVTHLTPARVGLRLDVQMEPAAAPQCGARIVAGGATSRDSTGSMSVDTALGGGGGRDEGVVVKLLPVVRGKGAFGRVHEGLYGGRRVAVKLLAEVHVCAGEPLELAVGSFRQEVEVLGRCQHPNIVRLLAACLTPPRLCLVMELMETSLERLLYGSAPLVRLPLAKVLHIGICVARALAYLHPTIVHRDIKPANVLINNPMVDTPVVKVTDFGLSRLYSTVVPTKHPDAGTPPYMAPECFDTNHPIITHQSDIYSLGILLWEMLVGAKPWAGVDGVAIAFQVCHFKLRPPLACLGPERCPPKLRRLLLACWEEVPARRPAAAEVAKELMVVLQAHSVIQQLMGQGGLDEFGLPQACEPSAQQEEQQQQQAGAPEPEPLLPLPPPPPAGGA